MRIIAVCRSNIHNIKWDRDEAHCPIEVDKLLKKNLEEFGMHFILIVDD